MALALVQELRPQWVGITRKVYQNYIVKRKSTGGDCTDNFLKLFEDMDEQLSSLVVEEASVHPSHAFQPSGSTCEHDYVSNKKHHLQTTYYRRAKT